MGQDGLKALDGIREFFLNAPANTFGVVLGNPLDQLDIAGGEMIGFPTTAINVFPNVGVSMRQFVSERDERNCLNAQFGRQRQERYRHPIDANRPKLEIVGAENIPVNPDKPSGKVNFLFKYGKHLGDQIPVIIQ